MTLEEQATGCRGAHGYRAYAKQHGYPYVEVYDWTSSVGDWTFLVSRDRQTWRILFQTNNYPRPGFSYQLDAREWDGTFEDVAQQIATVFG